MYNITLGTAYEELCRIFKAGDESARRSIAKPAKKEIKPVLPEWPLASAEVRNNTYSNLLSLLSLGSAHRESLLARGLSDAEIDRLGYRTTPAARYSRIVTMLLERGCELKGVPGFYCDEKTGQWKLDIRASGIMIPDRNENGEIEAIQIRLDKVYKSKFNTLTSVDRYYGATAACCPHFVGVTEDTETVYLTEGVMKSDIAHSISVELGRPHAFVGLTGVSNSNQYLRALEELRKMSILRIYVAFDMDDLINENVRKARESVIRVGYESGFEMTPIRWNPHYKGIDDLMASFKSKRQASA